MDKREEYDKLSEELFLLEKNFEEIKEQMRKIRLELIKLRSRTLILDREIQKGEN